jgi:hypothetical protein
MKSWFVCSAFMSIPPDRIPCDPDGIQQLTVMVNAGLNIPRYSPCEVLGTPSFDAHLTQVLSKQGSTSAMFRGALTTICNESLENMVVECAGSGDRGTFDAEREYCSQKPFFSGGIHVLSVPSGSRIRLRFDVRVLLSTSADCSNHLLLFSHVGSKVCTKLSIIFRRNPFLQRRGLY